MSVAPQKHLADELQKTREEVKAANNSVKETNARINALIVTVSKAETDINNGYKVVIPPETIDHQQRILDTFKENFGSMIEHKVEEATKRMEEDNRAFFKELDSNKRQILNATNKVFISPLTAWCIGINLVMLVLFFALNVYLSYGGFPVQQYIKLCHNFIFFFIAANILIFLYHLWDKDNERERRY